MTIKSQERGSPVRRFVGSSCRARTGARAAARNARRRQERRTAQRRRPHKEAVIV